MTHSCYASLIQISQKIHTLRSFNRMLPVVSPGLLMLQLYLILGRVHTFHSTHLFPEEILVTVSKCLE